MTQPELIEVYPVEMSKGGVNSHYHFCDMRGGQQSYAVCLNIISAIEEDRIKPDQFIDCQRACLHGNCNAKVMRAEEVAAGHALYFKPRTNLNPANARPAVEAQDHALRVAKYDRADPSYSRGWAAGGGDKPTNKVVNKPVSRPAPPPAKPKDSYVTESMADLVNVIAAEKPTSKEPLRPLPGETPLAFARRRAQAQGN